LPLERTAASSIKLRSCGRLCKNQDFCENHDLRLCIVHRKSALKKPNSIKGASVMAGRDRSSVITLAGAAGSILEQLVRNQGKTPFVDYARSLAPGPTPPRGTSNRVINELLGINPHKHMNPESPDTLEIDLEKCAENAITKAVGDHVTLHGREHDFIKPFLHWAWINRYPCPAGTGSLNVLVADLARR
jgi:hypothetical protein